MVEWIRAGVIGDVKRVIAWCSLNYRPFGQRSWSTLADRPPGEFEPLPVGEKSVSQPALRLSGDLHGAEAHL